MNAAKAKDAREVALNGLIQVVNKGRSLAELEASLNAHQHAALIREMVFGVCRYYYYFAHKAKQHLKKSLRKKDHDVMLVIFLGMYQLQFMHTSDHAALNETVKLLFKMRKEWAKGLVNALLRKYSQDDFESPEGINHALSYPQWMQQKIKADWSSLSKDIFHYGNQKAAISLRINTLKIKPKEFLKQLNERGIAIKQETIQETILPEFVRLTHAHKVMQLPGFEQGAFYVQDGSAQMAAKLLDAKRGMRVLDACAAPGGKATHIAELTTCLKIFAIEKEKKRIQRLKDNIKRLGHDITVICGDASKPKDWFDGEPFDGEQFDRILIDAPCSGSGIIRRHPDIKVLRRADDIEQLLVLQGKILQALWPLLKQGGELLYCTCSIFKQENEQQATAFIRQHEDCAEINMDAFLWAQSRPVGLQVLPSKQGHDGFYYAKLKKLVR